RGAPGASVRFVFTVSNTGSAPGTVTVSVYDHGGALKASTSLYLSSGSSAQRELSLLLPSNRVTYTWIVKSFNNQALAYDDEKQFTVQVVDLVLASRTAFLYERFESLSSGWTAVGGSWTIVSNCWAGSCLQGTDNNRGPGGSSVYVWQGSTPPSFQVLVKLGNAAQNDRTYRGVALLESISSTSRLYAATLYPTGNFIRLQLRLYTTAWSNLATYQSNFASSWYTLHLSYTRSGNQNSFIITFYDNSGAALGSISTADGTLQPRYLALIVDGGRASLFDELVAATGDPRFVNVTGLPSGWRVELWQGATLVASATADTSGNAALNVLQKPIIEGATFKIIDEQGQLVISKNFDLILGGDAYRLE
ncbi:MAG: hypothetical protein QXS92_04795, partial [Thermofilum sp.]